MTGLFASLLIALHPSRWSRWVPEALLLVLLGSLYSLRLDAADIQTATESRWLAQLTGQLAPHWFLLTKSLIAGLLPWTQHPLMAVRGVMVLMGLGTLAMGYGWLRLLRWPRTVALLAILVPALSLGWYQSARTLNPQLPLLFWIVASGWLLSLWWQHQPTTLDKRLQRWHPLSGWLGMILCATGFELGLPGLLATALIGLVALWKKNTTTTVEKLAFGLGYVVVLGLCLAIAGVPGLWPQWSAPSFRWQEVLTSLWQTGLWLFPWGVIAAIGWFQILTGVHHRQSHFRLGHRVSRTTHSWRQVWPAFLLLAVSLGIGCCLPLPWLASWPLLWGPVAAFHHHLTHPGRDQATLLKRGFDLTAVVLCLAGIGLAWWLFFELPDTYPTLAASHPPAIWLLPGEPSLLLDLKDLISDKLPALSLPVWKWWLLPAPLLLLAGAALISLLQNAPQKGALPVGLMSWTALWLAFTGLIVQPLLWPEPVRDAYRQLPRADQGRLAHGGLNTLGAWALYPSPCTLLKGEGYSECHHLKSGLLAVAESTYYQWSPTQRQQWRLVRYLQPGQWPESRLSLLTLVGGIPARDRPARVEAVLLLRPLPPEPQQLPTVAIPSGSVNR